ncbi:MAG: DUF460 domain-containing protein [Candidatus Aenigmatarchaeota archaeon]
MKNLIVGYDAGLNVGIAILDTEGNVVLVKTYRGEDREKIVREILRFGRPILFSTDKRKVSRSIKEVASSFGCRVFRPKRDFMIDEKEEIIKKLKIEVKDDHQRDALAAGFYAFSKIKKKLEIIKNFLEKRNLIEFYDEVIYRFFKNSGINLVSVLESLVKKEEIKEKKETKIEIKKQVDFFEESLKLKKRIKELEKELNYYRRINLIFSDLLEYKEKYLELEKYFFLLKKVYEIENRNMIAIVDLDYYDVEKTNNYIGLENKLVFSNDEKKFQILKSFGIRAIFTEIEVKNSEIIKVPIFNINKKELVSFDHLYAIEKKKFEKAMKEILKEEIKRWVEEEKMS